MAGGLLMALGGAMKGYGDATLDQLKEEAKAKREEALAQVQFERQRALAADNRQFQSDESQRQRDFTTAENEKTRADTNDFRTKTLEVQQQELDLKKQGAGELKETPDGPVRILGSTAEPVVDKDGNRIKSLTTAKEKPADLVVMDALVQRGIAKDDKEAWTLIKQGVKAPTSEADVERMVETATKTELDGKFGISAEEIQKTREDNRARIMKNLGMDKQQGQPSGQQSTGNPEKDAFIKQSIDNARAAISAGKPREKVIERLKAAGIDTTGL